MIKTEIEWFTLQEKMPNKADVPNDNKPNNDLFIGVFLKFVNNNVIPSAFVIDNNIFVDTEGCLLKTEGIAYWAYFPEGPPLPEGDQGRN